MGPSITTPPTAVAAGSYNDVYEIEAFGPEEELVEVTRWVGNVPRRFVPQDLRISVNTMSSEDCVIDILKAGVSIFSTPGGITLSDTTQLLLAADIDLEPLDAGDRLEVQVLDGYVLYGTNWTGLRIAFLGSWET